MLGGGDMAWGAWWGGVVLGNNEKLPGVALDPTALLSGERWLSQWLPSFWGGRNMNNSVGEMEKLFHLEISFPITF